MLLGVSERLTTEINKSLSGETSCIFKPQCTLSNPNTGFSIEFVYINYFNIQQDFVSTYMDMFAMGVDVRPSELKSLIENQQDLECTLILQPVNEWDHERKFDQDPIIFNLKVLIDEQTDLNKKYNPALFTNDKSISDSGERTYDGDTDQYITSEQLSAKVSIDLHMVEPEAYELRQKQINAMFNDVTMESLIHWIGQQVGAETVNVATVDNNHTYSNCVIPPMHSFSSIFPYLQQRYGVYAKGIGYYFTEKGMYVYPSFETTSNQSVTTGVIHLINAPEKYFLGMNKYHNKIDDDIYIATISPKKVQATSVAGLENVGNVQISTNADGTKDAFVQSDGQGNIVRNANDITAVTLQNTASTMKSNMQNVKYNGETTNIYKATTEMSAVDGSYLLAGWSISYPRLLKPGHPVIYHYDADGQQYETANGRLLSAKYRGKNDVSHGPSHVIIFECAMTIKLEPDLQSESSVQTLSN